MSIGSDIRAERARYKVSQRQLAERLGIHTPALVNIEDDSIGISDDYAALILATIMTFPEVELPTETAA